MSKIYTEKEITTIIDEDRNISSSSKETTKKLDRNSEPDYIKLYTRMWCEFNSIPNAYRELFIQLVIRMSYCNSQDIKNAQIVNTGKPWSDEIMKNLNWKQSMYNTGLKELCKCNAIKRVARGVYQINPEYASRGEWKYNPKLTRGGVEDLIAQFNFKSGKVNTKIIWANDEKDNLLDETFRKGLKVKKEDKTRLIETDYYL